MMNLTLRGKGPSCRSGFELQNPSSTCRSPAYCHWHSRTCASPKAHRPPVGSSCTAWRYTCSACFTAPCFSSIWPRNSNAAADVCVVPPAAAAVSGFAAPDAAVAQWGAAESVLLGSVIAACPCTTLRTAWSPQGSCELRNAASWCVSVRAEVIAMPKVSPACTQLLVHQTKQTEASQSKAL